MFRSPAVLTGRVSKGFGAATANLSHCMAIIASRIGLPPLLPGTFNIALDSSYYVRPDAALSAVEYNGWEVILLQRCTVGGRAAVITRPHTHEIEPKPGELFFGHGLAYLELMAPFDLARAFTLTVGDQVEVEVGGDDEWWKRALAANWGPRRASATR